MIHRFWAKILKPPLLFDGLLGKRGESRKSARARNLLSTLMKVFLPVRKQEPGDPGFTINHLRGGGGPAPRTESEDKH